MDLINLIFIVSAVCLITLNILLITTILSKSFKLWPTPSETSWQHYTFWPLFRGGLGLTLLYAIVTVSLPQQHDLFRFIVGMIAIVVGFGFTIYGYFDLGLDNTYGANDGLVTKGLYSYSRNPQYVASILGFSGVAMVHGGLQAIILCSLAVLVYVILPYTEEPWLHAVYGDVYSDYKMRVSRFI